MVSYSVVRTVRPFGWLKPTVGALVLLAGGALMAFGPPKLPFHPMKYEKLPEVKSGEAGFPQLGGRYPVERLARYRISREGSAGVELNVAEFRDAQGRPGSAIIYPHEDAVPSQQDLNLRHDLWKGAAESILAHTGEDALFVAWWDDAQRIRFLTGRNNWTVDPAAGAYRKYEQRVFWEKAGGGYNPDETKLRQLARWLAMDADAALAEMDLALPKDQPVYFLACLDDLARMHEIQNLSGTKLPFEARVFPRADNIHSQIAEVKRWAGEKGVGSYLVQSIPGGGVRAWRITTEAGTKTLLARLLPFTTSLAKPLDNQSLVYQSGWGEYLSIYEWRR